MVRWSARSRFSVRLCCAAVAPLLLSACIARTAVDVVTAPVRVVGQAADWATTSQDEADRNYGRRAREREADIGRLMRQRDRKAERCAEGDREACRDVEALNEQIVDLGERPI